MSNKDEQQNTTSGFSFSLNHVRDKLDSTSFPLTTENIYDTVPSNASSPNPKADFQIKNEKNLDLDDENNLQDKINEKYVESKIMREFLMSPHGLASLEKAAERTKSSELTVEEKIDGLIDFYTTWASTIPVRKNVKVNKYDFLKEVEEFCMNDKKFFKDLENFM